MRRSFIRSSIFGAIFVFAASLSVLGQTKEVWRAPQYSLTHLFTNNPYALFVITNLQAEPQPEVSVPQISQTNSGPPGTYWTFQAPAAPLPFDMFPGLPAYEIAPNE